MKYLGNFKTRKSTLYALLVLSLLAAGCVRSEPTTEPAPGLTTTKTATQSPTSTSETPMKTESPTTDTLHADVLSVQISGSPGDYRFSVEVRSPDLGCQQYADWWEVVGEDETLLYRRVLAHSHVSEQPFVRSGGPIPIQANTLVWVRAHMNTKGYGGLAIKGSVEAGFEQLKLGANFAPGLAEEPPLPEGCAF